jgi:hypothetical protein
MLALGLTGIVAAAEPTFHGKTFAEWNAQLGKGTSQERGRAAMALGLGPFGKEAVPDLIKALEDRDEHVRHCAVAALSEVGPDAKEAMPVLAVLLGREKDALEDRVSIVGLWARRRYGDTTETSLFFGILRWRMRESSRANITLD